MMLLLKSQEMITEYQRIRVGQQIDEMLTTINCLRNKFKADKLTNSECRYMDDIWSILTPLP